MKRLLVAFLLAFPLLAMGATDFRALLLEAMDAKDGKASADISGPVADKIRGTINRPNARIHADIITVQQLRQEGCKRFEIRFTTPGTLLPTTDGKSRMLDMSMQMNMCRNGKPPRASSRY